MFRQLDLPTGMNTNEITATWQPQIEQRVNRPASCDSRHPVAWWGHGGHVLPQRIFASTPAVMIVTKRYGHSGWRFRVLTFILNLRDGFKDWCRSASLSYEPAFSATALSRQDEPDALHCHPGRSFSRGSAYSAQLVGGRARELVAQVWKCQSSLCLNGNMIGSKSYELHWKVTDMTGGLSLHSL